MTTPHKLTPVQKRVLRWMLDAGGTIKIYTGRRETKRLANCITCMSFVPYFLRVHGYIEHADTTTNAYRLTDKGRAAVDPNALTDADLAELQHISEKHGTRTGPSTPPYDGYASNRRRALRLWRLGYVRVDLFSEQERGERRFYWKAFYLTDAGRSKLQR